MSGKMLRLVVLTAISGTMLAWAEDTNSAKPVDVSKGIVAPPAPSDAVAPREMLVAPTDTNAVIVTVNGKSLTMGMINWMQPNADPAVIKQIADFWVTTQLLNAEAVKRNVTASPKAQFLSQLNTMQAYGREVIQQVQEAVTVTDAEVDDYVKKNKDAESRSKDEIKIDLERRAKSKAIPEFINSLKEKAAPEIKKSEFLLQAEKMVSEMSPSGMGGQGSPGSASRPMPSGMRPMAPPPAPPTQTK